MFLSADANAYSIKPQFSGLGLFITDFIELGGWQSCYRNLGMLVKEQKHGRSVFCFWILVWVLGFGHLQCCVVDGCRYARGKNIVS